MRNSAEHKEVDHASYCFLFGAALGLLLPFLLATPAQAQATRTWVSGVGDDANPCSRTAPCKTFAGAISKTAAGGEIDCLDPGGFGAVTITKSITIDCGTNAGGILNSGANGVIINAGVNDKVVLRNLVIQGTIGTTVGLNGIRFLAGQELHLDRVVIQGQSGFCVDMNKTALGILYVRNSYFTECASGIVVTSTATAARRRQYQHLRRYWRQRHGAERCGYVCQRHQVRVRKRRHQWHGCEHQRRQRKRV